MFEQRPSPSQESAASPKRGFSADAFRRLSVKLAVTPQAPVPSAIPVAAPVPLPAATVSAASVAPAPPVEVAKDVALPEPPPPPKREPLLSPEQLRKADLARALMDLMSAGGSSLPQERALGIDTVLELLPDLRGPVLSTISERVAMMETPPAALVAKLVRHADLAVSGPLLEDGQSITDQDLVAVAAAREPESLRLIARRRRVSRVVSEAIAGSGDHSAMLTLIRNQGAEFSNAGFALLMEAAKSHQDLLAPLCTRPDLPPHLAFELFWFAPSQLRRFLMSRFLVDSEAMSALLKIKLEVAGDSAFQSPDKESVIAALGSLLGESPEKGFDALALCARVKPQTVARIVADRQGEALMALFKVMGIPRSEVAALLQEFAQGEKPLLDPSRDQEEVQAIFDQLSFNKARLLLTYWDWAASGVGPYAKKA